MLLLGVDDATVDESNRARLHKRTSSEAKFLLEALLDRLPYRSLNINSNEKHPVGTCQLIAKITLRTTPVGTNFCNVSYRPTTRSHNCPSVQLLLRDCPMPALRPKLIDLWRDFVDWTDEDAQNEAWGSINEILQTDDIVEDAEDLVACLGLVQRSEVCEFQASHGLSRQPFGATAASKESVRNTPAIEFAGAFAAVYI